MNTLKPMTLRQPLLATLALLALAGPAQACDLVCKIVNEATSAAQKDAQAAAQKLANAAATQKGEILRLAYADATTITNQANQQGGVITNAAQRTVDSFRANSQAIGQAGYAGLLTGYNSALKATTSAAKLLGSTLLNVAAIDAATAARLRSAGVAAANRDSAKLLDLQARWSALDSDGQQALNRVMRAIPKGQLDSQSMCDVPRLAKKLGLLSGTAAETAFGERTQGDYNQNIPGDLANSNFSLCLGGAGAYAVGGNASACFAMEVVPSDVSRSKDAPKGVKRAYKMAVVMTLGGSLGLGGGVGPSMAWQPGPITTKLTPNIGLEGALGPVGLGMSWDVALKDMTPIPGFALGVGGVGTMASWSIDAGVSFPVYDGYWTFSR